MELQTVDLSSVGTDEKKPVEFAGQPRLVILDNFPDVDLRFNQRGGAPVPAVRGDDYCLEEGFNEIYVENPLGREGQLRLLVLEAGEVARIESQAGVTGGAKSGIAPTRLEGNLAAGSSFNAGEQNAEEIDVLGVDHLDVRGRVSGLTQLSEISASSILNNEDNESIQVDPDEPRVFITTGAGNVYEVDVSDAAAPTLAAGPLSPAGCNARAKAYYDADNQVLLVWADDDGGLNNKQKAAFIFDASTVGGLSFSGSVNVGLAFESANSWPNRLGKGVGQQQTMVVSQGQGTWLIDYSTLSSPAVVDSNTNVGMEAPYWDEDHGTLYCFQEDSYEVFNADPATPAIFYTGTTVTLPAPPNSGGGFTEGTGRKAYDTSLHRFIIPWRTGSRVDPEFTLYEITPSAATVLDSVVESSGNFQSPEGFALLESDGRWSCKTNTGDMGIGTYTATTIGTSRGFAPPNLSESNDPAYKWGRNGKYIWASDQDQFGAIEEDPGQDVLEVEPLDPAGVAIPGLRQTAKLKDGQEGLVSMDLDGIETVRVTHRSVSGVAGQYDYVDAYREIL